MKYLRLYEKLNFGELTPDDVDDILLYQHDNGDIINNGAYYVEISKYSKGNNEITLHNIDTLPDEVVGYRMPGSTDGILGLGGVVNLYGDCQRLSISNKMIALVIDIKLPKQKKGSFGDVSVHARRKLSDSLERIRDKYNVNIFLFSPSFRGNSSGLLRCSVLIQEKVGVNSKVPYLYIN